jgi:hypothetical protein
MVRTSRTILGLALLLAASCGVSLSAVDRDVEARLQVRLPQARQTPAPASSQLIIGGTVRRVLGPGAFVIDDRQADGGERLVLAPDAQATPVAGVMVVARGAVRRFTAPELAAISSWNDADEAARERFAAQPILLAVSLSTAEGDSLMPGTPRAVRPFARRSPEPAPRDPAAMTLHAASLAELIDEIGGRTVTLPRARVLAVINPRVLLIESASLLQATIGNLDRVLVLIDGGPLRVDAALLTGADVRVSGTARTLLGARVTGEVAWPADLTPEIVKRLEVRAAVLATSIRTADGVELTTSPPPAD